MTPGSLLSDADLHGLVDGHLDPDRRAEVLRRAAASPRDRALVERWQEQADMLRAAFEGVEDEQVPSALDLRKPPKLHAVPRLAESQGRTASIRATAAVSASSAPPLRSDLRAGGGRRRRFVTAATIAAMAVGLAGSWYVAGLSTEDQRSPAASALEAERRVNDGSPVALTPVEVATPARDATAEPPATTTIPDLSSAGFTFTGADAEGIAPQSLIFRYRSARDEHIAVRAVRGPGEDNAPVPQGSGFTWRSGHVVYAIFGTVPSSRLGAIAASLRETERE